MSGALPLRTLSRDAIAAARARAASLGRPVLLALPWQCEAGDPLEWFAAHEGAGRPGMLWEDPAGEMLAAEGVAWRYEPRGAARFSDAKAALARLWSEAVFADESLRARCRALSAFSFLDHGRSSGPWSRFAANLLFVPERLLARSGGEPHGVAATLVHPGDGEDAIEARLGGESRAPDVPASDPSGTHENEFEWSRAEWLARAGEAVGRIRAGELDKVVLVRSARRELAEIEVARVARALRARHRRCTLYWYRSAGAHFIGATPERLVCVHARQVRTMALAGTAPRARDSEQDARNAAALEGSEKNREEHRIVAERVRRALQPFCSHLDIPSKPELLSLANVHHLCTPLRGRLAGDTHVLDLVAALHPTPAVGGHPSERALALIEQFEGTRRGLYAGPIGWSDAAGNGEFAVALRGAVLDGKSAHLFAGCGLVAESDPRAEWDESQWKLCAFESALNDAGACDGAG